MCVSGSFNFDFQCACVCLNGRLNKTVKDGEWGREKEKRSVLCRQADGLSRCLPRSSTSHPITPVSSHQLVVCHSLSSHIHSLSLPFSCFLNSHPSMLVCFVGCMSSVRCNLSWLIRCGVCVGVKPIKWCPPLATLPFSHIPLSVTEAVCIHKASACLEANRPSAVSKELLGWNPCSKDTWQQFTAMRDRTSTDPTVKLPLLMSCMLCFRGHSWVGVSFYFLTQLGQDYRVFDLGFWVTTKLIMLYYIDSYNEKDQDFIQRFLG